MAAHWLSYKLGIKKKKKNRSKCVNSAKSVVGCCKLAESETPGWKPSRWLNAIGLAALVLVALAVAYVITVFTGTSRPSEPPDPEYQLPPSPSKLKIYDHGAVCADGALCSAIGRDILLKNGSAVDAAVATLFCNGLVNCQSMGIGGGMIMMIYDKKEEKGYSLIAREVAPLAVSADMFEGDQMLSRKGALAVGVPGELKGYWEAHQKFGVLPWADIIQPTIQLCENGFQISQHQRDSLDYAGPALRKDPLLRSLFVNESTEAFHPVGTVIRQTQFCKTLRIIAEQGGESLYSGELADIFVQDVTDVGGIITHEDMLRYRVRWSEPITTKLAGDLTVLGAPLPGSGILLSYILKILDGFHLNPSDLSNVNSTVRVIHYMVEVFKYAFAKRGELGDPQFALNQELLANLTSPKVAERVRKRIESSRPSGDPKFYESEVYSSDDHGTAHVSVIDAQGNAVSVTSSVNLYFGAKVTSKRTGIILNSGIDDFSFPNFDNYFGLGWSKANKLEPGKMSLSSMSPTIVLAGNQVRLVVGASGGTKITTAVALVLVRHLWLGENLKTAIDASRFHHQLVPPTISYEYGMLKEVKEGLAAMGHNLTRYRERGSIVCALAMLNGKVIGNADFRKHGEVFGV